MIDRAALLRSIGALARAAGEDRTDRRLLLAVLLGYPAWQGTVRAGRALDRVAAPGLSAQPIAAPVFVVGHPRSGTTFFHRLLALDDRFCAPRAWELVLPAVSLHRAIERLSESSLARIVAVHAAFRVFDGFAARHATGWLDAEEDDWLMLQAVASPTVELLTGQPSITGHYWLGDELPAQQRAQMLRWYRRSVERILFARARAQERDQRAPQATWLSKSPPFTGFIRTLAAEFPDARFVMLVRHPKEAIASHLEMTTKAWYRADAGVPRSDPRIRAVFETSCALYRHAETAWAELAAHRRLRVGYAALVRDPLSTITAVQDHFGWCPDPHSRQRMAEQAAAARRRIPAAPVHLRSFGIRDAEVQERLGDLDLLRVRP